MPHALIVWGGLELHEPRQGAETVAGMLREEGFTVEVTERYDALGDPTIHQTDLVVPIVTGGSIDRPVAHAFARAVQGGMGLAGYHHCMATSFRESALFHYVCGSTWVAHPGNVIDYTVEVTRPDDPIMAGIASFPYRSEQYYLHYDPAVEVLATTTFSGEHDPWRRNVTMPVVYKTSYGDGRVFYSALGHQAHELKRPQVEAILRRGLLWAARPR